MPILFWTFMEVHGAKGRNIGEKEAVSENPKINQGYMGQDEFSVVENNLVRRFPVYKEGGSNAKPTGGTRQVSYKLKGGRPRED